MTVRLSDGTGRTIPRGRTWQGAGNSLSVVPVNGYGWAIGQTMDLYLRGPLNTLGVAPFERGPLAAFVTDANGKFQGSIQIPYANNPNSPFPSGKFPYNPDITRPGLYVIHAKRRGGSFFPQDNAYSNTFNICPNTL